MFCFVDINIAAMQQMLKLAVQMQFLHIMHSRCTATLVQKRDLHFRKTTLMSPVLHTGQRLTPAGSGCERLSSAERIFEVRQIERGTSVDW